MIYLLYKMSSLIMYVSSDIYFIFNELFFNLDEILGTTSAEVTLQTI